MHEMHPNAQLCANWVHVRNLLSKVNVPIAVRIGVGPIVVKILLEVYIWVLKCTPPVEF